jgi:hypothetical protein
MTPGVEVEEDVRLKTILKKGHQPGKRKTPIYGND